MSCACVARAREIIRDGVRIVFDDMPHTHNTRHRTQYSFFFCRRNMQTCPFVWTAISAKVSHTIAPNRSGYYFNSENSTRRIDDNTPIWTWNYRKYARHVRSFIQNIQVSSISILYTFIRRIDVCMYIPLICYFVFGIVLHEMSLRKDVAWNSWINGVISLLIEDRKKTPNDLTDSFPRTISVNPSRWRMAQRARHIVKAE